MAGDLRGLALEKAELLSSHLKELLSSGQGYVRARFGVDLGLKPELYPTWVILSTAAAGLLLLISLSWAAVCGGLLAGKKRGSPVTHGSSRSSSSGGGGEPLKAGFAKTAKPEEQKKKNKKKTVEKKSQSNGQPVTVAQEEVKVAEAVSKLPAQIKTEKKPEVQAPVQVKKNKKKNKTDVKPVQLLSSNDGKEPDDGVWETKVSNREKRQQRRKEKGPEDSGGSGSVEASKTHVEATVPAAVNKRNRGNHESFHSRTTGKGDTASEAVKDKVSSSWRKEPSVNGGGWNDMSLKIPGQMSTMEGNKWSAISAATHYRGQPEPQPWAQESQATAWSGIDGRIKPDLSPVSFSMLGLNTTDPISNSVDLQWASRPKVNDEWSGFNGMAAADPSSDWNAPVEHWGNYEEPPVLVTPAPVQKEQPVPNKVLEDERDTEDPSGGEAKSKKKRKKKKKTEEEAASDAQTVSTAHVVNTIPKPQELPALPSKRQNASITSTQKRSEQIAEPPKFSQKKKVRRET
ncbi:metadherin a isoform X1 [Astatotilapia calliptera]|uniref:Metadherin a n=1 Tax=Maylandia zebra TaxID=106582 RepID=A0A3P9B3C0_9CICH|nr:protein LYRIC isoform X1 [Maylandia zebra]XP_026012326.1 protein LYRIC-like isoform X1 [Astatotilapia calliptera]